MSFFEVEVGIWDRKRQVGIAWQFFVVGFAEFGDFADAFEGFQFAVDAEKAFENINERFVGKEIFPAKD